LEQLFRQFIGFWLVCARTRCFFIGFSKNRKIPGTELNHWILFLDKIDVWLVSKKKHSKSMSVDYGQERRSQMENVFIKMRERKGCFFPTKLDLVL